jgi:glycosyltransferase involved in cell wall biosynthesis
LTATSHPSVVHVLWSGEIGGIERLVHDLAVEQTRLGMGVTMAFAQARGPFADRSRGFGLPTFDLRLNSGYDVRPCRLKKATDMLATAEVVHAHAFNLPLYEIMRRAGAPIVFTHHGSFGLGRRLSAMEVVKQRVERRFLARHCAAIAANSRWTAERLSKTYGIDLARVTVVHNGLDPGVAKVPTAREGDDQLVVVFVGRLVRFKRVDRIVRAVAQLREGPSPQVRIVGRGPLEHELRMLARDLGVEGQIRFLGWRADIADVLSQADVLVLPSQGEPFGLAMIEASAHGLLPIAFSDGGGVLECMPPDGCVVRGVDELAATLEKVTKSEALSPAAREARSSWVRQEFPIANTAAGYLKLYRSVVEKTQ